MVKCIRCYLTKNAWNNLISEYAKNANSWMFPHKWYKTIRVNFEYIWQIFVVLFRVVLSRNACLKYLNHKICSATLEMSPCIPFCNFTDAVFGISCGFERILQCCKKKNKKKFVVKIKIRNQFEKSWQINNS